MHKPERNARLLEPFVQILFEIPKSGGGVLYIIAFPKGIQRRSKGLDGIIFEKLL